MNLSELLITAGGIGIVVKLLVDVVKTLSALKGRGTQALAFGLAIACALLGGLYYGHGRDIPEMLWLGVQAGAAAIGIDQMTKKDV